MTDLSRDRWGRQALNMGVLVLCALLLRILFWDGSKALWGDAVHYANVAAVLLTPQATLDPVYLSLFSPLVALFHLLGNSLETSTILASLVPGSLLVIPVYLLGERIYGRPAALLAALLIIIHPRLVQFSLMGYTEALYISLLVSSMYLGYVSITGGGTFALVGTGVFLGLTFLTRNEGLAYLPIYLLLLVISKRTALGGVPRMQLALRAGVVLLGFALVVGAYYAYFSSRTVGGVFGAKGAVNLLVGDSFNDPEAWHRKVYGLAEDGVTPRLTEELKGVSPVQYIVRHPGSLARRYVRNLQAMAEFFLPRLIVSPLILLLAPLGLFSSAWDGRRWVAERYLISFFLFPFLFYPLFLVQPQYFLQALPILFLWTGKGALAAEKWLQKTAGNVGSSLRVPGWIVPVLLIMTLLPITALLQVRENRRGMEYKEAGIWMRENLPANARFMAWGPMIAFYSGNNNGLFLPSGSYDQLINFARHHQVEYLVIDEGSVAARPEIRFLVNGDRFSPELELVYKDNRRPAQRLLVYRIAADGTARHSEGNSP